MEINLGNIKFQSFREFQVFRELIAFISNSFFNDRNADNEWLIDINYDDDDFSIKAVYSLNKIMNIKTLVPIKKLFNKDHQGFFILNQDVLDTIFSKIAENTDRYYIDIPDYQLFHNISGTMEPLLTSEFQYKIDIFKFPNTNWLDDLVDSFSTKASFFLSETQKEIIAQPKVILMDLAFLTFTGVNSNKVLFRKDETLQEIKDFTTSMILANR